MAEPLEHPAVVIRRRMDQRIAHRREVRALRRFERIEAQGGDAWIMPLAAATTVARIVTAWRPIARALKAVREGAAGA